MRAKFLAVMAALMFMAVACDGHGETEHDQVASVNVPGSDPWTIRSNHQTFLNTAVAEFTNNSGAGDEPFVKMCMEWAETETEDPESAVLNTGRKCVQKTLSQGETVGISQTNTRGGFMHPVETEWRLASDPNGDNGTWCEYHDPDGSNPTSGWLCVARDLDGN